MNLASNCNSFINVILYLFIFFFQFQSGKAVGGLPNFFRKQGQDFIIRAPHPTQTGVEQLCNGLGPPLHTKYILLALLLFEAIS